MSSLTRTRNNARYYQNKPFISIKCKCGCKTTIKTKDKTTRFVNHSHYLKWIKENHVRYKKRRWKKQKRGIKID